MITTDAPTMIILVFKYFCDIQNLFADPKICIDYIELTPNYGRYAEKPMQINGIYNDCILNLKCLLVSGLAGHMQDCAVLSASLFYCICLTIIKPCNVEV